MRTALIDLHLHLDGSLNIMWAYKKALERQVIPADMRFEAFYDVLYARNGQHSADSIRKFEILCDVLQYREDLYEAAYDLVKRMSEMGLIYVEIRFASQQHCKKGLSQYDALKAVCDGVKKAMEDYPIQAGVINCLMHKGDSAAFNYQENLETIEVTEKLLKEGALGLDLAGYENNCDYSEYAPLFEIARSKGIPFTLHAGEMGIGAHILDALKMHPDRIGHGINCIQDESYLSALKDSGVTLEVCVSSNVKVERNYAAHPVRRMIQEGLKVTINTDNMIFARSDTVNEHHQLRMIGFDDALLQQCTLNAIEGAFCNEEVKEELRRKVREIWKEESLS